MCAARRAALGCLSLLILAVAGLGFAPAAGADPAQPLDPVMRRIKVDEHRAERIDPDLEFVDHDGQRVRIGDFFDGDRPVLITLNYYRCRVVCSVQLNELAEALKMLQWTPGDEHFQVVTVSVDPKETHEDARRKRNTLLTVVDKGDDIGWHFLTGDELQIRALAAQLGIGYAYDAEQDQYAHPAVANFLTADGRIAQYVYGLTFDPLDLKLGLLEAGEGKIGGPVDQILLSCFSYDHELGRYGAWAFGIMRLGGIVVMFCVGGFLLYFWRRERRRSTAGARQEQS